MPSKQLLSVAIVTALNTIFIAAVCAQPFKAERAEDWDALFLRDSGWTGGDGIYSIPFNGVETPGAPGSPFTLFVFSDTFIGEVGPDGERLEGVAIVNNTLALLRGTDPVEGLTRFYWATDEAANPIAAFSPETPDSEPGDWYWLMDGVVIDFTLHFFALRMTTGDGGPFNFAIAGVSRLSTDLMMSGPRPRRIRALHSQVDTPLFAEGEGPGGGGEMTFGSSIMVNTEAAGSISPDGYVYVYGIRSNPASKSLLAARVLPEEFTDFEAWRYWDGSQWVETLADSHPVAGVELISPEMSVSPLPDGRFALVSQYFGIAPDVQIHIGDTPVGPFDAPTFVWECPEAAEDPDVFCYNAKAHPHLSAPGEFLISYNVNTFDFFDHFTDASIYRPRFIRVTLP